MVRPQRFDAFWSDSAISSTIGVTVLFLSAVVSAGAVYASVSDFGFDGAAAPRLFNVESSTSEHHVRLQSGTPIYPGDAQVVATADGVTTQSDLYEYHAPALEDGAWTVDETICLVGPSNDCLFDNGYAIDVKLTAREMLIFEGGSTLEPGGGGGGGEGGGGGGYTLLEYEDFGDTDDGLVQICHKPGTNAEKTKSIPYAAFGGHSGHGDTVGACSGDDDEDNGKLVICHMPGILDLTLTVAYAGWNGHSGHGDTVGACS